MELNKQLTTGSLLDKVKQFVDFQKNAREQQAQDFGQKRTKQQQDLYTSGLSSTNPEISKKCTKAVRVGQIAEGIRDYFSKPENGGEDYSNIEDVPLVDNYISLNPDRKAQLYDYVLEDNQICDPTQLYTDMGWISEEDSAGIPQNDTGNSLMNRAGGLVESALGLPKFAGKVGADLAEGSIKLLGGDEERAKAAGDKVRGFIDKIGFGDKESSEYQSANLVGDIAQMFVPGGQYKAPAILAKFPKLANVLTKVAKNAEKYPALTKLLKWGSQGVDDTLRFNAINQEYASPEEMTAGGLLNIAFGKGGEAISKIGGKAINTMGIKGIMNTSKAEDVIEAIQKEGGDSKTIEDLAAWFNARGFKGTKEEIVKQLEKHGYDARQLKLELLKTSNNQYKSAEATEILEKLQDYYQGSVGQKADYDRIAKLIKEGDMYTPSELDNIQHELSMSSLNPFKKGEIGVTKDARLSDILGKDYNKVKTLIEDIGEKEGLGNIKALNNEITVANKMKDGIAKKSMTEEIKDGLKGYALPGAVMGYLAEGDLGGALKGIGALYTVRMLGSTTVRTYLSSAIQSLKGAEKTALTKWLGSNGKAALSESENKAVVRLLEEAPDNVRSAIINTIIDYAKEGARMGTVVGGAEIVDSVSGD